jgi:Zn-dependent peptidase ImmA (M78 family)
LEFYSNFPYLGVYNAELVAQQRPGAKFVLTAKKWAETYHRKIKPNARPLIILVPFHPVDFLFDVTDTKPIDNKKKVDDNAIIEGIIERFMNDYKRRDSFYMDNLWVNLEKQGIYFKSISAGSELYAEIITDQSEILYVQVYKDVALPHHNYFTISVNSGLSRSEALSRIFHELAHLFCHHFKCAWWEGRLCSKIEKEFEAETVSFLVCQRLGIKSHAVEYLANYFADNNLIPEISAELVFQAVDIIQDMASGYMSVIDCLLYKKDKEFKAKVDIEREKKKKERERAKALKVIY